MFVSLCLALCLYHCVCIILFVSLSYVIVFFLYHCVFVIVFVFVSLRLFLAAILSPNIEQGVDADLAGNFSLP